MKRKSLELELKNLKYFLKKIGTMEYSQNSNEAKVISHTLVGMIMTIHNLAKTGAYNDYRGSRKEIYDLIEKARNNAIHYGFFNNLDDIYNEAQTIIKNHVSTPDEFYFASTLPSTTIPDDKYYQIIPNGKTEIKEVYSPENCYKFKSLKSSQEIYVKKEDIVILKNKLNDSVSYLLKESDEENMYFKDNDKETVKISFNTLLNNGFFNPFSLTYRGNKLSKSLNKILSSLNNNPYKNLVVTYKYNNKNHNITAHNLLLDYLHKNEIDEKVAFDHFHLTDYDKPRAIDVDTWGKMPIRELVQNATLQDMFFVELFLKRYHIYNQLKQEAENNDSINEEYAKQSLLTNLFEIGASSFSEKFLKADKTGKFNSFYHEYRNARNQLAHFVSSSPKEKEILTKNLETFSETFYNIFSKAYQIYYMEKRKHPLYKFPTPTKDSDKLIIHNKSSHYFNLEHSSISKIINGKKYLKLKTKEKNIYIEMDGCLLSLNYNNFISQTCLVPKNHAVFVRIDPNTSEIKHINYRPDIPEVIEIDPYMETLIQAQDIYKAHPCHKKKIELPSTCIITYYDKFGTAYCSEGVRNLLYRKCCQKIIPQQLLEAHTLVIPQDADEPLQILNKNKQIVAKVYYACINNIDGKDIVMQLLKDGTEREIEFGRLLPKDLKTNQLIMVTKEDRR